ncbi:hypothetical protein WG70_30050 [Burkholderia oklahomensis EO147]|nr:hypothetical protein WG70_30050 [Burkholderia oklahomensis EO147]KUY49348.1 hypothetical protein WG70_20100 [Burkholderia oklahomensis EO147]
MRIASLHAFVGDSPIIAASSGDVRSPGRRRVLRECSTRAADWRIAPGRQFAGLRDRRSTADD